MQIKIIINLDNADFKTAPLPKLGSYLNNVDYDVGIRMQQVGVFKTGIQGKVRDGNGDTIGTWKVIETPSLKNQSTAEDQTQ